MFHPTLKVIVMFTFVSNLGVKSVIKAKIMRQVDFRG